MHSIASRAIPSIALVASLFWTTLAIVHAQGPVTIQSPAERAAEDRIVAILRTRFAGKFENTPLDQAIAGIAHSTGLPIQFDTMDLDEALIAVDSPVSCELPDMSLHSALDTILHRFGLTWVIDNECVLVTTPDKAGSQLTTKVYPVQDLLSASSPRVPYVSNVQALVDTITSTIAPTTWDDVGGPGDISFFPPAGALVISQTREVHEQIEMILPALRAARDTQHVAAVEPARRRHSPRRPPQPEPQPAESPRYVVSPSAAWSVPRVHE